jgi:hypothetical protein
MQPNAEQNPSFNSVDSLTRWLISTISNTQQSWNTTPSLIKIRILPQDGSLFLHVTFPGNRLTGETNAPSLGAVKVNEQVLVDLRAQYLPCIAEGYISDDPEYIVYDVLCFLAHAKSGVINLKAESDLREFLLEAIKNIEIASPDLEYFRLHTYDDRANTASKRVIITFHERIYDVGLGRDIPQAPLSSHPHTIIPAVALEEFKDRWVQTENTLNNINYPKVVTYFIPDFVRLAQE